MLEGVSELACRPVEQIKGDLVHRGKAKALYRTPSDDLLLMEFTDEATAFDGGKKGTIDRKGFYNAYISAAVFRYLARCGLNTHFAGLMEDRYHLVRSLQMFELEVVIRNVAAGSLVRRLGFEEGMQLSRPILEYSYKDDELGDPWMNRYHIRALSLCSDEEIIAIEEDAWRINAMLRDYFAERKLMLVDFKLEFGRSADGSVVLGDEITPDTCRLWDMETADKLDKDRFRFDMGGIEDAYREVYRRVAWEA
ncbi:MAG: phosphoribosylaminoimidazolesuccinocarboxamide synthase [Bacillota bacterium]